jgi:HlyD family secretion protein
MSADFFEWKTVHAVRSRRPLFGVVGYLVVALCSAGATGCGGHDKSHVPATEVPAVTVVTPRQQSLKRTILQPGYAKPYEQTPIYARIPGYVSEVKVDIGDQVKKGDLLASLRVPELEQELNAKAARAAQAKAQVKQSRAALEAAKANVETTRAYVLEAFAAIARGEAEYLRWQAELERGKKLTTGMVYDKQTLDEVLFQKQAAHAGWEQAKAKHLAIKAGVLESEARRDKAGADVEAAESSLLVAEADRDQAQVWLNYRDIVAPYDGVVTRRNVHTGHFLQASSSGSTNKSAEPIFTIVRSDIVRIAVQVPEYDAPLVTDSAEAIVRFQGLKDAEIVGKVTRTSDVLDNEARTLKVEIHLPNADRKLRPGMYVNVAIKVQTPPVWTLPADAVFTDGDKSYCFVVDQEKGKAIKTALKIGVSNDVLVEVLKKQTRTKQAKDQAWEDVTGLEPIVAANPESLIDGQGVTVARK